MTVSLEGSVHCDSTASSRLLSATVLDDAEFCPSSAANLDPTYDELECYSLLAVQLATQTTQIIGKNLQSISVFCALPKTSVGLSPLGTGHLETTPFLMPTKGVKSIKAFSVDN